MQIREQTSRDETRLIVSGQLLSEDLLRRLFAEILVPQVAKELRSLIERGLENAQRLQTPVQPDRAQKGELLTVGEAAERLGVSVFTIRSWIRKCRIEVVKIGRCVRIPECAVQTLIDANTVPVRNN